MSDNRPSTMEPVAIVGMSAIMPGARELDDYWRNILQGRDLVTDVPADRWRAEDYYDPDPAAEDKTYCKRGAFLPEVEFDPAAYGLRPSAIEATDTAQLLALIAADRLLTGLAAVRGGRRVDGERVSVYLGSVAVQLIGETGLRMGRPVWLKALRECGIAEGRAKAICDRIADHYVPWQAATLPGVLSSVVAGRIANTFDLHGGNFTVDAACASSLAAVSVAVDDLLLGRADLVITGGADTLNDPMTFTAFSKAMALSRTGDCRPFAEDADGTVLGEGIALLALRRLADAERDGDRIYAVIRGVGASSDGSGTAIYAPLASGQARALRRAYGAAGYGPDTVSLVEAHGTGTVAGDSAEVTALREVFTGTGRTDTAWCALGSVKSQIGHTTGAAGAAGLIKAALALHHRVLPPTIKAGKPNPALGLDGSPFYLNTAARPWVHTAAHARRAAVSSFGFGGSNVHITLEEYPADMTAPGLCAARPSELVVLSADTPAALVNRCRDLVQAAGDHAGSRLATLARRSHDDADATAACRLAVVATDGQDLAARLRQAASRIEGRPQASFSSPQGIHYGSGAPAGGRIAFVFPGQGTQRPQMGAEVALHFPRAHEVWQRAAALELGDRSLADVVFPPPATTEDDHRRQQRTLTRTEWAQPALAAHSLALLDVLDAVGIRPDCVAGHSFGELTALHAARVFDADTLLLLARRRGELMRDAAAVPGGMLAVDAPADLVADLVADIAASEESVESDEVWVAADNAPGQTVLSGSRAGIARAEGRCSAAGITSRRLEVATAFHSPLMSSAAAPLADFLSGRTIRAPWLDVYGNADAALHPLQPDRICERITAQLASPIRFTDMIRAMYADGVRTFLEVGPGQVLTRLIDRILGDEPHHSVPCDPATERGVTGLNQALARLFTLGVTLRPAGLWAHHAAPPPDRKTASDSALRMRLTIDGGNYGRRYPASGAAAAVPPSPVARDAAYSAAEPGQGTQSVTGPDFLGSPTPEPQWEEEPGAGMARALLEVQRQTAQAHAEYLRLAEKSIEALAAGALRDPHASHLPDADQHPPETADNIGLPPLPHTGPTSEAPGTPEPAEVPPAAPVAPTEMESLVLSVVSEKTGYPVDMLAPHMELEADLGLDSITRMQILGALRPMFPTLENVDRSLVTRIVTFRTVGEVADHLRELLAQTAPASGSPAAGLPAAGVPATVVRAGSTASRVHRHVPVLRETPAPGREMAGLRHGTIVVTGDRTGIGDEVARQLREHGVAAESRPTVPTGAAGVIFLGGLARPALLPDAFAMQREALRAAHTLAPRAEEQGGVLVTVQNTGGDFGLGTPDAQRAWTGGLAALARTAMAEWPKASVKAIDHARGNRTPAEIARGIVEELLTGGQALNVGLSTGGVRRLLHFTDAPDAPVQPLDLPPHPVIVASGGAGGITAAALVEFARACPARFVLLGRTAPDGPHGERIRATTTALEEAGAHVRYLRVDIRDRDQVGTALEEVRSQWGPVTGLVHGAGVIADRRIRHKTLDQFDSVFTTKVEGLAALLEATRTDPLRLLCAFSSVASSFGNAAQSDYAMANETLNHMIAAEHALRGDACVRALVWGPWRGGMVSPELADLFAMGGVPMLSMDDGARAFVTELTTAVSRPQVLLAAGPLSAVLGEAGHAAA
ncbi:type I polyketide synthase [Streptomyces sp. NPDC057116]|uniref:type I polyketide synthase n=1 Tax=Streptomyces sp. NPDC057116 TaxID=3346023 RepID=UPI00362A0168